ncbi:MAG TPA: hypothetical protein VFA46_10185 [Actinomycetes bacterium]|nr:hypothetical protein [Actinomycetes bacterium]
MTRCPGYLGLPPLPYARRLPGVELLFLDAYRPDRRQGAWLDRQLGAPGPALRVVVFHQPAYSCGTVHGSTRAVIRRAVRYHFVAVEVRGGSLSLAAVAEDGSVLDRTVLDPIAARLVRCWCGIPDA